MLHFLTYPTDKISRLPTLTAKRLSEEAGHGPDKTGKAGDRKNRPEATTPTKTSCRLPGLLIGREMVFIKRRKSTPWRTPDRWQIWQVLGTVASDFL